MLTDEQFDELANKLLKKIAPKLGVELEEEQPKSATAVRDKDGEEYDLEQCAIGPCVVTTEGTYYSFTEDGICGFDDYREYWVSTWGESSAQWNSRVSLRNWVETSMSSRTDTLSS